MRFTRLLLFCPVCLVLLLLTGCHDEEPPPQLKTKSLKPLCTAYSPDSKNLVVGYSDGSIMVWDAKTGEKQKTFKRHDDKVEILAFSANGATLASDSPDRTAKVSPWNSSAPPLALKHDCLRSNITLSPDGKTVALIDEYRIVKLYAATTGKQITELNREGNVGANALGLEFSPDGKSIAVGFDDHTLQVFSLKSPKHPRVFHCEAGGSPIVAYSSDGKVLAGGGEDVVEVWDMATGKRKFIFPHTHTIFDAAFSPDGKWLATSPVSIKLWDVVEGTSKDVIVGTFRGVQPFSPDGTQFAAVEDNEVYVYDTHTWTLAKKLVK